MLRAGSTALLRSGAARSNGTNVASTAANVRPPAAVRPAERRHAGLQDNVRRSPSGIRDPSCAAHLVRCRRALLAAGGEADGGERDTDARHGDPSSSHKSGGPASTKRASGDSGLGGDSAFKDRWRPAARAGSFWPPGPRAPCAAKPGGPARSPVPIREATPDLFPHDRCRAATPSGLPQNRGGPLGSCSSRVAFRRPSLVDAVE